MSNLLNDGEPVVVAELRQRDHPWQKPEKYVVCMSDGEVSTYVPERTCTYVEHSGALYHYYECSECQYEMDGGDFNLYSPNYCMDCGAEITDVVNDDREDS